MGSSINGRQVDKASVYEGFHVFELEGDDNTLDRTISCRRTMWD